MGSLPNDLLKLLVHSGLQVGGNVLGQMITQPMLAKRQENLQAAREAYQSTAGASQKEMAGVDEFLKKIRGFGLPTAMAETGRQIGPEGQMTEGGVTPRPGVTMTPELEKRFVGAPTNINQVLGKLAEANPEIAAKILDVRGGGITEALQGKWAHDEAKDAAKAAERDALESRREAFRLGESDRRDTRLMRHQQFLMEQQGRMFNQQFNLLQMGKAITNKDEAHKSFTTLAKDYNTDMARVDSQITQDIKALGDPSLIKDKAAYDREVKMIKAQGDFTKWQIHQNYKPLESYYEPHGFKFPEMKDPSERVFKGLNPAAAEPKGSSTPTTIDWSKPRRVMVNGKERIVNNQAEYDAARKEGMGK